MSLREFGRKAILAVGLLAGAEGAAMAKPPEKPTAAEKARVRQDADASSQTLEAKKKKLHKETTEADIARFMDEATTRLVDALQPDHSQKEAAAKKMRSLLAKAAEKAEPDATPAQWLEAAQIFEASLRAKLLTDQGQGGGAAQPDKQKPAIAPRETVVRAEQINFVPLDYIKGGGWTELRQKMPKGEDPQMWQNMVENGIRRLYAIGTELGRLGLIRKSSGEIVINPVYW